MKKTILISALVLSLLPLVAVFHKIGEFPIPSEVNSIVAFDNIAYVIEQTQTAYGTLYIIDVSDPMSPILLASILGYGDIVVEDSIAYLGGGDGFQILNVSNPQNPILLGTCDIGYTATLSIAVQDSIVYVGHGYPSPFTGLYSGGLQIINVSNPQNPTLLGSYSAPGQVNSIAVVDSIAYIGVYQTTPARLGGLWIIDVSNPQSPVLLGSFGENEWYPIDDLTVMGNLAYIAVNGGLQIIDISNPQSPFLVGSYVAPGWVNSVTVINGFACIGYGFDYWEYQDFDGGFQIIDVSNPQNPILHSDFDVPGVARFVGVFDGVAYVGSGSVSYFYNGWEGVQMFDVSEPQNPSLYGCYNTLGEAKSVFATDDIAYIADGYSGLVIIDTTNPYNPAFLGSCETPGEATSVTVSGDIAYVADGYAGLQIIDISAPWNPTLLSTYHTSYWAYSVNVEGDIAYVVAGAAGLQIIDVSNPQNPTLLGICTSIGIGQAISIIVSSGTAYVTVGDFGLKIFNVSNPQSPVLLSSLETPGGALSVTISGNIAYVADGASGVQIVNVSNPASPVVIGNIPPHFATSSINKCYINENFLYISDVNWYEISVYNIGNPQIPVLNTRYPWNHSTADLFVVGDRLYTANEHNGLNILNLAMLDNDDEFQYPATSFQMRNYPNPFNQETNISYTLPAKGQVCLSIYNSKGQLVKSLLNDTQAKGEHTLTWNGKDKAGHSVASGLYFCRITSAGKQESRKLLLLK